MKEKFNWRALVIVVLIVAVVGLVIYASKNSSQTTDVETQAKEYVKNMDEKKLLTKDDIIKAEEKTLGLKLTSDEKSKIIDDNYTGPTDAKVTVIMYEDFACAHCQSLNTYVDKIIDDYKDKVLFIKRDFSLGYPNSLATLTVGEAARKVGGKDAYWKMSTQLFSTDMWTGQSVDDKTRSETFNKYAKAVGLSQDKFNDALSSYEDNGIADKMARDKALGEKAGVTGTPTWFVNNKQVDKLTDAGFRDAIEDALKK